MDDAASYHEVREAMDTLGLAPEEQDAVYSMCAGILHLSKVSFASARDSTTAAPQEALEKAAELWGVDAAALATSLTQKETALYTTPLTPAQATDCRDALCKALYDGMFRSLIERLNEILRPADAKDGAAPPGYWIGLLDIFGFERFEVNSLEQLCINLANEQLQSHYNKCVFEQDMVSPTLLAT